MDIKNTADRYQILFISHFAFALLEIKIKAWKCIVQATLTFWWWYNLWSHLWSLEGFGLPFHSRIPSNKIVPWIKSKSSCLNILKNIYLWEIKVFSTMLVEMPIINIPKDSEVCQTDPFLLSLNPAQIWLNIYFLLDFCPRQ